MRVFVAALRALAALASASPALARMRFESPPEFTGVIAPSKNPVYAVGTPLWIRWTPATEGKKLSVMLYQLTEAQAASFNGKLHGEPAEYITRTSLSEDQRQDQWLIPGSQTTKSAQRALSGL
jgi:hypothetical protein